MDNESSLLAYLVPRFTGRGEDTATDALAFILNKSEACRRALDASHRLDVFEDPGALHAPIYLKAGVEYLSVLDDVADQLRRIKEILLS